ncbi:MAG: DUF5050 domain-containing protein [Oscillospiraceae bacterium]|nr:DUF5050 domain-containing protein [Oscillospiraceae bacterium]
MKKIISILLALTLCLGLFAGCKNNDAASSSPTSQEDTGNDVDTTSEDDTLDPNFVPNTVGNTNANIINNSLAAQEGSWIYYISQDESSPTSGVICRQKLDGTELQSSYIPALSLNVINGVIYYTTRVANEPSYGIYKLETKQFASSDKKLQLRGKKLGSIPGVVGVDAPTPITVVGDWLYYLYCTSSGKTSFYNFIRIKTGDGKAEPVTTCKTRDNYISHFNFYKDRFYYYQKNFEGAGKFYRIDPDGENKKQLSKFAKDFILEDGIVYYADGNKFYKFSLEKGEDIQEIGSYHDYLGSFTVSGGQIFFTASPLGDDVSEDDKLIEKCVFTLDASGNPKALCSSMEITSNLSVAGDWLFFNISGEGNKPFTYKINKNGQGQPEKA